MGCGREKGQLGCRQPRQGDVGGANQASHKVQVAFQPHSRRRGFHRQPYIYPHIPHAEETFNANYVGHSLKWRMAVVWLVSSNTVPFIQSIAVRNTVMILEQPYFTNRNICFSVILDAALSLHYELVVCR